MRKMVRNAMIRQNDLSKLTKEKQLTLREILGFIFDILSRNHLTAQAHVVYTLIQLLEDSKLKEFVTLANAVDMWGGSGSVWEVNINDSNSLREFELLIINFVDLMEECGIMGRSAKQIRKIFYKNKSARIS